MSAREKIAYIKGLLDAGTLRDEFDTALYGAIVEALDAIVDQVEDQEENIAELVDEMTDLVDYCEGIGEDLMALEDDLGIDANASPSYPQGADDDRVDTYESILCPFCSTMFYYRPDLLQDDDLIQCPNCKRNFAPSEVELEED